VITFDELCAEALAADPDAPVADDAVPFGGGPADDGLLPAWYCPVPAGRRLRPPHRPLALLLVGSFLVVSACGLCCTYGALVVA
jgi:hypothetical protein